MANNSRDAFEKNRKTVGNALKQDVLNSHHRKKHPEVLDWLAGKMAAGQSYQLNVMGRNQQMLTPREFRKHAPKPYLEGLASLMGERDYRSALDDDYPLGAVLVQSAGLIEQLDEFREEVAADTPSDFDPTGLDPGEALGRLVARELQRNATGADAQRALDFRSDTRAPRELVEQICAHPSLADGVREALPENPDETLINRLGHVELTTELWDHQRDALVNWLADGANGYVNMATATGKTVLGLAAVGYCTPSGALHPTDRKAVAEWFSDDEGTDADGDSGDPDLPRPSEGRPDDVLIVTTDDLLGVQWGRLFQEHCNTPEEFTQVVEQTIALPWGRIDIRAAGSLDGVDPSDYRLAIFDEVHNYSGSGGWGEHLVRFVDADCPVLALTGSVNEEITRRFRQTDREFPQVFEYDHETAKAEGVIPDFEWSLSFAGIDADRSATLDDLKTAAREYGRRLTYDGSSVWLTDTALAEIDERGVDVSEDLAAPFDTPIGLARALKAIGGDQRAPTDRLDRLASALLSRQTFWWNLRTDLDHVATLASAATDEGRPTLILTRSYKEAEHVEDAVRERTDGVRVFTLDSDKDASGQDAQIQNFDDADTERKVLVGPGDPIGTGTDIQTVEVGINLARPGSGVSASLVQRLGRLLRNASDKHTVEFYHVMGVPPESAIAPPDGERFVRNAVQFFTQAVEPDGDGGISALPHVHVGSGVAPSVASLERHGLSALRASDADCNRFEAAYADAIADAEDGDPVADTPWWTDLDGVDAESSAHTGGLLDAVDDDETDETDEDTTGEAVGDESESGLDSGPDTTDRDGGDSDTATESGLDSTTDTGETESMDALGRSDEDGDGESTDDVATDDAPSTSGETVEIDGVLLALVERAVANDRNDYDSRGELVRDALEEFLGPVVSGDHGDLERQISTDRRFDAETDPVLGFLLEVAVQSDDRFDSPGELAEHAVLEALDVDHRATPVVVPGYDRYEFVVERLVESDDCPHASLGDIVHAALGHHLGIPSE